jgi:hypothetical protein
MLALFNHLMLTVRLLFVDLPGWNCAFSHTGIEHDTTDLIINRVRWNMVLVFFI